MKNLDYEDSELLGFWGWLIVIGGFALVWWLF